MKFSKMFLAQIVLGVIATKIAVKVARPALVAAVGVGFRTKDMAKERWSKAKSGLDQVVTDARAAEMTRLKAHVEAPDSKLTQKEDLPASSKARRSAAHGKEPAGTARDE